MCYSFLALGIKQSLFRDDANVISQQYIDTVIIIIFACFLDYDHDLVIIQLSTGEKEKRVVGRDMVSRTPLPTSRSLIVDNWNSC